MAEETRLRTVTIATLAVLTAGLGVVEALDQFGASPLLPALYPILPLGAALFLAFRARSLAFADMVRGGRFGSQALAFASAGVGLSAVLLIAAPVATALGGWHGFIPIAAVVAGLLGATLLVMPSLRAEGASSLADAVGRRFGRPARAIAAIAILMILLPLLAAEISLAGEVGARMLGIPAALGREIMIGLALAAGLTGGVGAGIAIGAVLLPVVIVAFVTPVGIVSLGESAVPMPWIGLFDPTTLAASARVSTLVLTALSVLLAIGIAVMPTLLFPAWNMTKRRLLRSDFLVTAIIVGVVLLAAPSYAVYGKIAGIEAGDDPSGLVLGFPDHVGLSATPSVLLIGGLLVAALAATVMNLVTAGTAVGHDLYGPFAERRTPDNRRVFVARLAMIVIAVGLVAYFRRPGVGNIAMLAGIGLSMSVATLAPILLFGGLIRHHRALSGAGAMIVGMWLTAADIILAWFFPAASRFVGMETVTSTALGPTGWFGLPVGLSGMIGFAYGTIALFALSVLPRLPWRMTWIRMLIAARHLRRRLRRLARRWKPPAAAPEPAVIEEAPPAPVAVVAAEVIALPPPIDDPVTIRRLAMEKVLERIATPLLPAAPAATPLLPAAPPTRLLAPPVVPPEAPAPATEIVPIEVSPMPEPVPIVVAAAPSDASSPPIEPKLAPRPKWRYRRPTSPFPRLAPSRRRKAWRGRRA